MGLLSRSIFREVSKNALFGAVLFTFVLFLQQAGHLFEFLGCRDLHGQSHMRDYSSATFPLSLSLRIATFTSSGDLPISCAQDCMLSSPLCFLA